MFSENSRTYLDNQPSLPDVKSMQTKGEDQFNSQKQATGKSPADNACHFCGSAEHWMKYCPHKSTQFAGSQGQSSSSGGKNQSMKNQPRPTSGQKGDKGRGKGKGKKDVKKKLGNPSSGGKIDPQHVQLKEKRKKNPSTRLRIKKKMKKRPRSNPSIYKRRKNRLTKKNSLSLENRR